MMKGLPGLHDLREEVLERVWALREEGTATVAPLLELGDPTEIRALLQKLETEGLLEVTQDQITLTRGGEGVARHVVRAHRLSARLLTDLLELPVSSIEGLACRLEHAISPELADGLCTLLGHPPTSPTGKPIPRGQCCETLSKGVAPMVRQLPDLALGKRGRVTFIHPRFTERLDILSSMGLVPGTEVRLTQRHPSIVLEIGETTLALDMEVARDIFIKPLG